MCDAVLRLAGERRTPVALGWVIGAVLLLAVIAGTLLVVALCGFGELVHGVDASPCHYSCFDETHCR